MVHYLLLAALGVCAASINKRELDGAVCDNAVRDAAASERSESVSTTSQQL